jgi:hypothetical protein
MEPDVMVYGSFHRLLANIQSCDGDIAYPLNLGSLLYIQDLSAMEYLLQNFLHALYYLRKQIKRKFKSLSSSPSPSLSGAPTHDQGNAGSSLSSMRWSVMEDVHDMELLRMFKVNHRKGKTVLPVVLSHSQRMRQKQRPVQSVSELSAANVNMSESVSVSDYVLLELPDNPYTAKEQQHCLFQRDPHTLYDPHRYGQLLGGLPRSPWVPFINRAGSFRPNRTDLHWIQDSQGYWLVKYQDWFLFNLHIENKLLSAFRSDRLHADLPSPSWSSSATVSSNALPLSDRSASSSVANGVSLPVAVDVLAVNVNVTESINDGSIIKEVKSVALEDRKDNGVGQMKENEVEKSSASSTSSTSSWFQSWTQLFGSKKSNKSVF